MPVAHIGPSPAARARTARLALDLMRPSDAFAVSRKSLLDDPSRWLRPTLMTAALLGALALLIGRGAS